MPRFLDLVDTDPSGLRDASALPVALPYHLDPRAVLRCVEDVHKLLHELNNQLDVSGYEQLEGLLDPAGFSGLLSRAVVDSLARQSKRLKVNGYHNGYPDLVEAGIYVNDSVQRGDKGGLEVKASRNDTSWQSHSPRAGWFCVVQFRLDEDDTKALKDREPTRLLAVMVAELETDDWSWAPAGEGKKRTGTASITVTGRRKLRAGAVWVDPDYEAEHRAKLAKAVLDVWSADRNRHVADYFYANPDDEVRAQFVIDWVALQHGFTDPSVLKGQVSTAITALIKEGTVTRVKPGVFRLTPSR